MGEVRDLCRADRVDLFETMGVQQTFDGGGGEEFSSFRGQLVQAHGESTPGTLEGGSNRISTKMPKRR